MNSKTGCPQCRGYHLLPFELESGLVAGRCKKCGGVQLPLINYRFWLARQETPSQSTAGQQVAVDNEHAVICSKCHRLMTKYRIGHQAENRVDYCASCDEIWLDNGEWELLGQLHLQTALVDMLSDAWQRKIREEQQSVTQKKYYEGILGNEDFSKVEEFKQWLHGHAHKDVIKVYLHHL